jgi:superfamily II DNA or RNA helicase
VTTSAQAWTPDPSLVQEIRDQFGRAVESYRANPNLVTEHANHEEQIRVGGYANRALLELVQNAADAMSGVDASELGPHAGRVEIVLDVEHRTLYCANAGRPFSRTGIISISQAYLSGKRGDEIGRFGLGFKSVLAVTQAPHVFSRSVSFEFNSSEARDAISSVDPSAKRLPVLRTPTLVDASDAFEGDAVLSELSEWATTIVKLPHAENLERLRREMEDFDSEFLLFVSSVREVRLRVLGADGFSTSHVSRNVGNEVLRIERPDGTGDEWIVKDSMHEPSIDARKEVGEAVSRSKVKVTVALPVRLGAQRRGRFWSYFPLQDQTSASALFNAPWSVNDDRTTLLRNDYNREILLTMASLFVELIPRVSRPEDPAAHLDYLPARGREELSFGDAMLCTHVPRQSLEAALIPDAHGDLRRAPDLRPLDFAVVSMVPEAILQAWSQSPNTKNDVPHWRCYSTDQRIARLRKLCVVGANPDLIEEEGRDMKRALETMPKRGLSSWLREWADGVDVASAADAFRFVMGTHNLPGRLEAKVIPTNGGPRTLNDRSTVFLQQEEGVSVEGGVFVDPTFLRQHGIEKLLREAGFRDLDPEAVLRARVHNLSADATDDALSRFWDAALGVSVRDALRVIGSFHRAPVKVPTLDGGWAWPQQVVDLDEPLGGDFTSILLDHQRCLPELAYSLGVVRHPVKRFDLDDEPRRSEYESWVLATLNSRRGAGDRPIESIELTPPVDISPGPFSVLLILKDAGASDQSLEAWTRGLLSFGDQEWDCEDVDSGSSFSVLSPVRWAVDQAGMVNSTHGLRPPAEVVAPSLVRYQGLLPLYRGPSPVADVLKLPDELEDVPPAVLRAALEAEGLPSGIPDSVLSEFVLESSRLAYPGAHPPRVLARVGRVIESRPPNAVYLAVDDEQQDFLRSRQRPFLRATEQQAAEMVTAVGCQRFEDSFAFSMLIEGEQAKERILDRFTGLRNSLAADLVTNATVTRAARITKQVTTVEGVEPQSLPWYLDGADLLVQSDFDDNQVLSTINEAFALHLTNSELESVRQANLDHQLERVRQEALAAPNDAERLGVYFGNDDLREALPKGLWQALEGQRLVDDSTSVGELFLTVYGSDSVKNLADLFRQAGFPDVPGEWAGRAPTISWLRRMGFGSEFAGQRTQRQDAEFVVPGATSLNDLHDFQKDISKDLRDVLTRCDAEGRALKAMVELPTGAGKTRVATETVLRLFIEGKLSGTVVWIAQSQELCEQAVQTWSTVWRGLRDERPLTIGRLWETNTVHEPDTEFSVVVATDAKLDAVLNDPEYGWLWTPQVVIVDEGHVAGDSTRYTRILSRFAVDGRSWERPLVGLSATPFKGRSVEATQHLASRFGHRILTAFKTDAYGQLAALGVLARIKHEVLPGVTVELSPAERADALNRRLVSANVLDRIGQDQARMAILVRHVHELVCEHSDWPVLVFTPSVLSAQVLAATLRYRNIRAASVSGQTGRQQRRDYIRQFKEGEIQVLANCDLLAQGFDAPGVRALYIARPTFSPNAYIQMAGRGLRGTENGGKEECLIVDMADNFGDINDFLGFREYEGLWKEQS